MKHVLGISFGRNMSNTEVMIKQALLECEKKGHSIQIIRADDLDVKICNGCCGCVAGMLMGRGRGDCWVKDDDFHIIDEALMACDAVIVGSPTYVLAPTGNFKKVCDRLGPSHDVIFRKATYEAGLAQGLPPEKLPDPRNFKKRVGALITVGGATTENWLSFSMPSMYEFTMSMGIDVIDAYQYHAAMNLNHVLGSPQVMERMTVMGRNIAEALAADSEEERVRWRADWEGTCPACHCDMLTVMHKGSRVECPVCGIEGDLRIENGDIKVHFPDEQIKRSRLYDAGKVEHYEEIKGSTTTQVQVENLEQLKAPYLHVGEQ